MEGVKQQRKRGLILEPGWFAGVPLVATVFVNSPGQWRAVVKQGVIFYKEKGLDYHTKEPCPNRLLAEGKENMDYIMDQGS